MLEKLTIQNVALIERAEIEFGPGLNILSGETGAGKSVILDSINFVLGAKADRSMIRYGEDACSGRAVFRTEGSGQSSHSPLRRRRGSADRASSPAPAGR